jgi:hypothetical protein
MKFNIKKVLTYAGVTSLVFVMTFGIRSFAEEQKHAPGIPAKIESVSDSTLTVYLADMPERPTGNGSETPSEKPGSSSMETPPEKPSESADNISSTSESRPEPPKGTDTSHAHGEKPTMNFKSETTTYTLSDSVEITKGMDHTTASLSDLTADSVVNLTLDSDVIIQIDIMEN